MSGPDLSKRRTPGRVDQRGMTLIELMVGLVVALLVALAAIASAQFFMGRQRAALDVESAGGSEATGLAAIKFEVAQAALGFYADGRLLCPTMNLSQGAIAFAAGSALPPLNVTLTGDAVTIDVLYGDALEAVSPVPLAAPTTGGGASLTLASHLPIAAGQALVLVPAVGSSRPCTVRTATAVTPATDVAPLRIDTDPTGVANQLSFAPVTYTPDDVVGQLGRLEWSRFRLDNGSLLMERPLTGSRAVMVRNVVAMAAEYGVADASGTAVGAWRKAIDDYAVLDAARLATVRAMRIGIVVRSQQPDRKDATGHCVTTPQAPALFHDPVAMTDPDWACYRYRVGTIVVPLRNVVMGAGA